MTTITFEIAKKYIDFEYGKIKWLEIDRDFPISNDPKIADSKNREVRKKLESFLYESSEIEDKIKEVKKQKYEEYVAFSIETHFGGFLPEITDEEKKKINKFILIKAAYSNISLVFDGVKTIDGCYIWKSGLFFKFVGAFRTMICSDFRWVEYATTKEKKEFFSFVIDILLQKIKEEK